MSDSSAPQATLVLDFGDGVVGTFKAHRYANQLTLVENIDNVFASGYESIKAITTLIQDQVLPEDLDELREFLHQNGRNEDYAQVLYDALDNCWKGETGLPLEPSSTSFDTSSTSETDQSSKAGSSSPDIDEMAVPVSYQMENWGD